MLHTVASPIWLPGRSCTVANSPAPKARDTHGLSGGSDIALNGLRGLLRACACLGVGFSLPAQPCRRGNVEPRYSSTKLYTIPGLGHAYFIAFYALKKKAKIRELKIPGFKCGFKCGPPLRRPFLRSCPFPLGDLS